MWSFFTFLIQKISPIFKNQHFSLYFGFVSSSSLSSNYWWSLHLSHQFFWRFSDHLWVVFLLHQWLIVNSLKGQQWWSWILMKMGLSSQEGTTFLNLPKTHWFLKEIMTNLPSFPWGFSFAKIFFFGPTLFKAFWT